MKIKKTNQVATVLPEVINVYSTSTENTYSASQANKANNFYSENEVKIGIWIDNKPIYRKIFPITAWPNTQNYHMPISIPNVDTLIECRAISRTSFEAFAVPSHYGQSYSGGTVYYDTLLAGFDGNDITYIRLKSNSNRSNYSGFAILEYTKTTD